MSLSVQMINADFLKQTYIMARVTHAVFVDSAAAALQTRRVTAPPTTTLLTRCIDCICLFRKAEVVVYKILILIIICYVFLYMFHNKEMFFSIVFIVSNI